MTTPAIPDWALQPGDAYRNIPGEFKGPEAPFSWEQLRLTTDLWINIFVGKVAIAFGGIQIAGWKPLDFLADWGQQRIDDALEAYNAALAAQGSANYANTQLTIITGGGLASDVAGGIAVNDPFNGASSTNLGSNFTLKSSDGPGAGDFGLSGTGRAVWKESGGNRRRKIFQHNTALATDYQAVFTVVGALPQKARLLGSEAYTYLCGRMDSAGTTFIYGYIAYDIIGIGKCIAGTFTDLDDASITLSPGDQISLLLGTDTDDCQFIIKQNGVQRLEVTETTSFGASYRYAGVGAQATPRTLFFDQTVPAELDVWAASDRLATTI